MLAPRLTTRGQIAVNYDVHVTIDKAVAPVEYNFKTMSWLRRHDQYEDD